MSLYDGRGRDPEPPGATGAWAGSRRRTVPSRRARGVDPRGGGPRGAAGAPSRGAAPPHRGAAWKTRSGTGIQLSALIANSCRDRAVVLSDRVYPSTRIAFDHLIVAPSGVWVIASEWCKARVEVVYPPVQRERLLIGGRDQTDLIDALTRQTRLVQKAMDGIEAAAQLHPVLCLVTPKGLLTESGLPVIRTLTVRDVPLLTPQRLVRQLQEPGLLTALDRTRIARALAQRFPAAGNR